MTTYKTTGTCSRAINYEVPGGVVTKCEFVDAPVVNELPLVLECELVSMNEENCNVVGKIVNCAVEESALMDGKPDAAIGDGAVVGAGAVKPPNCSRAWTAAWR